VTTETRDVLISVLFGLGFIVFFMSLFGFVWLLAFGVAKFRRWRDSRGGHLPQGK
jgi:hypothetical protein